MRKQGRVGIFKHSEALALPRTGRLDAASFFHGQPNNSRLCRLTAAVVLSCLLPIVCKSRSWQHSAVGHPTATGSCVTDCRRKLHSIKSERFKGYKGSIDEKSPFVYASGFFFLGLTKPSGWVCILITLCWNIFESLERQFSHHIFCKFNFCYEFWYYFLYFL